MPLDIVTEHPEEDLPETTEEYAIALWDWMEEVHHQVRDNLKLAGEAMKEWYDRSACAIKYESGNQVNFPISKKGLSPKL